jgi:hypothetical protein
MAARGGKSMTRGTMEVKAVFDNERDSSAWTATLNDEVFEKTGQDSRPFKYSPITVPVEPNVSGVGRRAVRGEAYPPLPGWAKIQYTSNIRYI